MPFGGEEGWRRGCLGVGGIGNGAKWKVSRSSVQVLRVVGRRSTDATINGAGDGGFNST